MYVSIHAPVKGATVFNGENCIMLGFNSRTRKGCDNIISKRFIKTISFNSRTRKGCDSSLPIATPPVSVSIHAPVKGATMKSFKDGDSISVSIHAPVKGATSKYRGKGSIGYMFQFTHP